MTKVDGDKVINFIESYYKIKLSENEIRALSQELKGYTYTTFLTELKEPLLASVEYFTIAQLHRIIENNKKANMLLKRMNVKNWNDFLAN